MRGGAGQTVREGMRIADSWLKSTPSIGRVQGAMAVYGSGQNFVIAGITAGGIGSLV
jgi:hypothetical protein